MNKKKRIFTVLSLVVSLLSLSSCYLLMRTFSGLTNNSTPTSTVTADLSVHTNYGTPKYTSAYKSSNMTNAVIGSGSGYKYLPSIGNQKILVVPVATQDDGFTDSQLTGLKNVFFGEASETGWQSVSSFYKTSSYGQLNISGEVTKVVTLNKGTNELAQSAKNYGTSNGNFTDSILDSVLGVLEKSYDLASYDVDGDGYIDAVWMVYAPAYSSTSDLYWAYTTWKTSSDVYDGKMSCLYSWASIDFLTEMRYAGGLVDAHTFIHETGHMLGLDDYYSYDYSYSAANRSGNTDTPVGGVDMMDFNVGDHCAFSKFLLGWKTPTVLTPDYLDDNGFSVTLNSQTETGESLLLPIYKNGEVDYNGTPFDEYLLIEYYTPTGLNYKDSLTAYANGMKTYSDRGVLVYHINATIGRINAGVGGSAQWDGNAYDKLPDYDSDWGYSYLYTYLYNNTYSYSWDQTLADEGLPFYRGRLISLLPATGNRINGSLSGYSNNKSLFKGLNSFLSTSTYTSFVFDNGSKPEYGFTVSKINDSNCTLTFKNF